VHYWCFWNNLRRVRS